MQNLPMALERYLQQVIRENLKDKMVFLAGPRQVGKSTLARSVLEAEGGGRYLSWESPADRPGIRTSCWPAGEAVVVLDELHKWRSWKSWLKGEFDKHGRRLRFLVTSSARLDIQRRGGDPLPGRYHLYRLHPFSYVEAGGERGSSRSIDPGREPLIPGRGSQDLVDALMEHGGFPEPFLGQSPGTLRRWQRERLDRLFSEDVRILETIRDLSSMRALPDLLPERIGSLLSLNALRQELEVSHRAVTHWMDVLERLHYVFRIPPFASRRDSTLQKTPRTYLWDSSLVPSKTPRFENLLALHLLKFCHFLSDAEGHRCDLHYLRDRYGREVGFLVTSGRKPWFAVEAKLSETRIDPALPYYRDSLRIPYVYQVTLSGARDFVEDGVRCLPARLFLGALI